MVVSFEKYHNRRQKKLAYRQELVERIFAHHRQLPHGDAEDSFFLQHVREGFPINILENILARLDAQRASGE
ncbi:MAG: hypothetical protein ACOVS5_05895 [Oligoflexus sp.]|jgi:hypothetical protein